MLKFVFISIHSPYKPNEYPVQVCSPTHGPSENITDTLITVVEKQLLAFFGKTVGKSQFLPFTECFFLFFFPPQYYSEKEKCLFQENYLSQEFTQQLPGIPKPSCESSQART